jgi:hypothetical protein
VLSNLAARQHDIQVLLQATDSASHETADLVQRNRAVLDQTLGALHQVMGVIDQHQVDLAATVTYLNQAVQGYASVGYSNGYPNRWANIFVQSLGPAGVDALIGPCGAVDQLIDRILGTDCRQSPGGSGGNGGGNQGGQLPLPPPPSIPKPPRHPPKPPSIPPLPSLPRGAQGEMPGLLSLSPPTEAQVRQALPQSLYDLIGLLMQGVGPQ